MKAHRLLAWPDLPEELQRTAHRRALSQLSQRHLTLAQVVEASGLRKAEARTLLALLDRMGMLDEKSVGDESSFRDSLGRLIGLRRAPRRREAASTLS